MTKPMHDFLATFRTRRLLCQTLLDLTTQQQSKIDAEAYDELIEVLERKDRVLDRLRSGEASVNAWKTSRDELANDVRSECEALLEACEQDLQTIRATTETQSELLTGKRHDTADRLRKLTAGSAAVGGTPASPVRGGSTVNRYPRGAVQ